MDKPTRERLPLEALRVNSENPKKPLGAKYRRGLRASLARYGFAGVLVVAANDDGTHDILDGNTRFEELEKAGEEEADCIVYRGMSADERKTFVVSFDRNRKIFDEDRVLAQLEDLAGRGADLKALAQLSGKENLERLLAESSAGRATSAPTAPTAAPPAMASLVLYGPSGEVKAIGELLKTVKGKLSTLERARKAIAQAVDFLDFEDEKLLAVLLATIARFGEEA